MFETLTYHFSSSQSLLPWMTRDQYPRYFAKADVVGFDLYPVSYFCGNRWIGLRSVYDELASSRGSLRHARRSSGSR